MDIPKFDQKYMRRALELAARGRGMTGSNPMVGAVIVAPDGRIIGEGWHRCYGQGHAEVNAVNSVSEADRALLPQSTIYVTLEPCSHYGKTPPCAQLLIDHHIPNVVVGAGDPNPKVNGRGVDMLREAGAKVVTGVLAEESEQLNCVFFTAMREHRAFVTLKWAQSADGYMDHVRLPGDGACRFSCPEMSLATMKLRSENGAIVTTAATALADNPRLTVRGWPGRKPMPVVLDRKQRLTPELILFYGDSPVQVIHQNYSPAELWQHIREEYGVTSVLVEAGPRYLQEVLDSGAWDALRVEIAPFSLCNGGTAPAPALPHAMRIADRAVGLNRVIWMSNNPLFTSAE